jgi:cytochrome c-type biogenesis protein CcmH
MTSRTLPGWTPLAERGLALGALAASAWLVATMGALAPAQASDAPHDLGAMAARLESRLGAAPPAANAGAANEALAHGGAADDGAAWALLARSHAALGDATRAERAYERALALSPNDAALWAERAQTRVLVGTRADHGDVQSLAARALALDPAQPLALALTGDAAYERGELAAARSRWSAAARLAGDDGELASSLARRLAMLDSAEKALRALATPVTR